MIPSPQDALSSQRIGTFPDDNREGEPVTRPHGPGEHGQTQRSAPTNRGTGAQRAVPLRAEDGEISPPPRILHPDFIGTLNDKEELAQS